MYTVPTNMGIAMGEGGHAPPPKKKIQVSLINVSLLHACVQCMFECVISVYTFLVTLVGLVCVSYEYM